MVKIRVLKYMPISEPNILVNEELFIHLTSQFQCFTIVLQNEIGSRIYIYNFFKKQEEL